MASEPHSFSILSPQTSLRGPQTSLRGLFRTLSVPVLPCEVLSCPIPQASGPQPTSASTYHLQSLPVFYSLCAYI